MRVRTHLAAKKWRVAADEDDALLLRAVRDDLLESGLDRCLHRRVAFANRDANLGCRLGMAVLVEPSKRAATCRDAVLVMDMLTITNCDLERIIRVRRAWWRLYFTELVRLMLIKVRELR